MYKGILFYKIIDRYGSYHVGRYKTFQKLILLGSLHPISNKGSSKYQLRVSLVAARVTVRLV